MWTIATPFIKRDQNILPFWLEGFERLDFPRKEFKLLWLDLSKDRETSNILKDYLSKHGDEFKEVEYIDDVKKEYVNIDNEINRTKIDDNFYIRRKSIAETFQILNEHRKGNLVILEDDIVAPPDAWNYMKEVFDWSPKFYGVTAVQVSRHIRWPNHLLIWDWKKERVYPKGDTNNEETLVMHAREEDREDGFEFVGSTATGFILIREEFLNSYSFISEGHKGQDVMLGYYINGYDKCMEGTGGKLMLCWKIKLAHIGMDNEERFKIYRSKFCKTEVYNEHGVKF